MALPYDLLFLGGFAYAGQRILGRWLRFSGESSRGREDSDFFATVEEALQKQSESGARPPGAGMGRGAAGSGQGHLWAEWGRLRPEQRARLLQEMLTVLRATGQLAAWRRLARARGAADWARLGPAQRGELVWAADSLDWGFVERVVSDAGAAPQGPLIWEVVSDALPQLSEEPLRRRRPRDAAGALRALAGAREAAVGRALHAGRGAAAAALADAARRLGVADAAERLRELRGLLQGTLGFGSGGRAVRGAELLELLAGVSLSPASFLGRQLKEAALQELEAEVDKAAAPQLAALARQQRPSDNGRSRLGAVEAAMRAQSEAAWSDPAVAAALLAMGCEAIGEALGVAGFGGSGFGATLLDDGDGGDGGGGATGAAGVAAAMADALAGLAEGARSNGGGARGSDSGASSDGHGGGGAANGANGVAAPPPAPAIVEAARLVEKLRREVDEAEAMLRANNSGGGGGAKRPEQLYHRAQARPIANGGPAHALPNGELSPRSLLAPCLQGLIALATDVARAPPPGAAAGGGGGGGGAVEALKRAAAPSSGGGGASPAGGRVAMANHLAEMRWDIASRLSLAAAAEAAERAAARDAARAAARAEIVARRGAAIEAYVAAASSGDAAAAAAAAAALAAEGLDPARPSAPIRRLAYAELRLRQVASSPLAQALPAAQSMLAALEADAADAAAAAGPGGGGGALELDDAGAVAAWQLRTLLDEISLIDAALGLSLGPGAPESLARIRAHLEAEAEAAAAAANGGGGGGGGGAGGGADASDDFWSAASTSSPMAAAAEQLLGGFGELDEERRDAVARCRELADALAEDPLVALGLPAASYAALRSLRAASASLRAGGGGEGGPDRGMAPLRSAAAPLVEAAAAAGAAAARAAAVRSGGAAAAAMAELQGVLSDVSGKLQALLAFEDATRAPALAAVRALKVAADAASVVPCSSGGVRVALEKTAAAEEQITRLAALLERMPCPSPTASPSKAHAAAVVDASEALSALRGAASELRGELGDYLGFAEAREAALAAMAAAAKAGEAAAAAAAGLGPGGGPGGAAAGGGPAGGGGRLEAAGVPADAEAAPELRAPPLSELAPELNAPLRVLADASPEEQAAWEAAGLAAVARGQVAAVLLATSLVPGSDAPRALAPAPGLPSRKCPLQLYAERLLRLQRLAARSAGGDGARPVPFVILTRPATHGAIVSALEARRWFGLAPRQVQLVCCHGATPRFDSDLRAVLSGPSTLATGDPGSADALLELRASGALSRLRGAGVRHVEINTVDDNLLWRPADPMLVGYMSEARAQAAAKVLEPSSLPRGALAAGPSPAAAALARAAARQAPAVGVYCFSAGALERLGAALERDPLACARLEPARGILKRGGSPAPSPAPAAGADGPLGALARARAAAAVASAVPRRVEGYALRRGIADVLRAGGVLPAGSVALLAVPRCEELATVHPRGPHWPAGPPEAAAARLLALHAAWIEAAGGAAAGPADAEVPPAASYAGEGLEHWAAGGAGAAGGARGLGAALPQRRRSARSARAMLAPLALAYLGSLGLAVSRAPRSAARR
ncbi:hypothetical protein Rsub_11301 [Raphidocelis subcapitata]|uniref:Uncharacterized protein n=1 Tax=Raphidocelis subcapitata TaxID=307507 RepID=A0A2V0PFK8_9CHLO|nr:hypothetical protein Rsub_11301 [Raphidocelis subcapitata]|eukprot:GBF98576.1 hypothetical protein Rsub_11301 [Raphidocelis subcapitata]